MVGGEGGGWGVVKRGVYSSRLYPSISGARPAGVKLRGGQRGDSAICTSQPLRGTSYLDTTTSPTSQSTLTLYLYITPTLVAVKYFPIGGSNL